MNRSRVRFPQAAPIERHSGYKDFRVCREVFGVAFSLFWSGLLGVGVGRTGLSSGSQPGRVRAFGAFSQWVDWPVETVSVKMYGACYPCSSMNSGMLYWISLASIRTSGLSHLRMLGLRNIWLLSSTV